MKFNRGVALGTSFLLVLSACGGAQQERTRNEAVPGCRDPLVQTASQEYLQTQIVEVGRLKSEWEDLLEKARVAFDVMLKVKDNVPQNLRDAVQEFDKYDLLVMGLEKQIEEVEKSDEKPNMKIFITSPMRYDKKQYEYKRSLVQEEMNRLRVIRAEEITKVNDAYNSAVINHDVAYHAYLAAAEAHNKVVALSALPSCRPMLNSGDAETYVADVAAQAPPTSIQRRVFQFFEDPAPSDEVNQQGGVDSNEDSTTSSSSSSTSSTTTAESSDSSTSSSSTTLPKTESSSTLPSVTSTAPSPQEGSETSEPSSSIPRVVIESAPQLVVYEDPKDTQILDDLRKTLSDLYRSDISNTDPLITDLVKKILEVIEKLDETKSSENDVFLQQIADSISVVVEIVSRKSGSESGGVSKKSFSVVATGFRPQADVVVVNKDGDALARTKAGKDGIVNFEMSTTLIPAQDGSVILYLGGTKENGDVSAVPFLVNSNSGASSSETTNSSTTESSATTMSQELAEENGSNSTMESVSETSSSTSQWIALVVFILLVVGLLVVFRRRKRQELDQ
jgi:LPXTG-motif cell wall-anchored protein